MHFSAIIRATGRGFCWDQVFEDLSRHAGAHFEASSPERCRAGDHPDVDLKTSWNSYFLFKVLLFWRAWPFLYFFFRTCSARILLTDQWLCLHAGKHTKLLRSNLPSRFFQAGNWFCTFLDPVWPGRFLFGELSALWDLPIWHMVILFVDPSYFGCFVPVVFDYLVETIHLSILSYHIVPFLVKPCQVASRPTFCR